MLSENPPEAGKWPCRNHTRQPGQKPGKEGSEPVSLRWFLLGMPDFAENRKGCLLESELLPFGPDWRRWLLQRQNSDCFRKHF